MKPEIALLLQLLDQAYDHKSWHGTNLRGSVRGLDAATALRRPAPGRHNIQEIVVHAAYWKYVVRRRLLGERRGSFPLKGSNWFPRPVPGGDPEAAWAADLALLKETHVSLRQAVVGMPELNLEARPPGSTVSNGFLLSGIASHDLYHAGQIQLVKRMVAR